MSRNRPCIGLIAFGDIPAMVPKVIAAHISGYLDLRAVYLDPMPHPAYALDRQRRQYDVGPLLQDLETRKFNTVDKIIGILDVDLFVPVFAHVFGEARQGGRVALVSIYRLKENAPDPRHVSPMTLERAAMVALHELGHLFSLVHCDNQHCLMHFSGSLPDLDHGSLDLCRYCKRFFEDAVS